MNNIELDKFCFQKMVFIYNALQDGWVVKKKDNVYIFTKKHENKKEVYLDTFLNNFISKNTDINRLIQKNI
jgi:hypothetical protein